MPFDALRSEIVHELAHVYASHAVRSDEIDEVADKIASGWGFEQDIKAFRAYKKEEVESIEKIET